MINIKLLMKRITKLVNSDIMEEIIMSESEKRLESVKSKCKTASVVLLLFKIILAIAIVLCVIGIIISIVSADTIDATFASGEYSEELSDNINFSVQSSIGIIEFDVDELFEEGMYAKAMSIMCSTGLCVCIVAFITVSLFKSIFDVLTKGDSPFEEKVIKKLKSTFIFFAIGTMIIELKTGIMVGLFLWCIYGIFQYGGELQRQSDETL